jgi:cytochrome P450
MHEIRANLELFQGAATDTSHLGSNSFLLQMALNPEVQKQMIE